MPRRHIDDTPTSNPYMFDDSIFVIMEDVPLELEDSSGYLMYEGWEGTLGGGLCPGTWEDYLTDDVIKVRNRLGRA